MSVIFSGTEMESMYHDGREVETWIHNGVEVYTAGKMVTYVVDTNTSYEEKVKKGHSCLSPTTFTPSKSGWTFLGWRTDKTASSDVLTSKVMERSPITLYAVFKATITCYTYNGSSSRTSTSGTRYYNNGNYNNPTFKLTQNGISGWSANGWCTSNGATAGIAVANGGSVTLSGDATYYGRYSQTIYLYYNGNGNTGGSTGTQSGTRYFNSGNYSNPTFTIAWNGYSRTNYSFVNWRLNSASGTAYSAGSTITLSSNATLYATWTLVPLSINTSGTVLYQIGDESWQGSSKTESRYIGPYSLNGYSTLTFECHAKGRGGGNNTITTVGVCNTNGGEPIVSASHTTTENLSWDKNKFTLTLDVSSLNGSYYIMHRAYIESYNWSIVTSVTGN